MADITCFLFHLFNQSLNIKYEASQLKQNGCDPRSKDNERCDFWVIWNTCNQNLCWNFFYIHLFRFWSENVLLLNFHLRTSFLRGTFLSMGNRGCWVVVTSSTWKRINEDNSVIRDNICPPHLAGVDIDTLYGEVRPRAVHQPSTAASVQDLQNRA